MPTLGCSPWDYFDFPLQRRDRPVNQGKGRGITKPAVRRRKRR